MWKRGQQVALWFLQPARMKKKVSRCLSVKKGINFARKVMTNSIACMS
jgi:hypothetical protein